MHAGPESRSGIDVEDQSGNLFLPVFHHLLRLLPGGDYQHIVDPELMEILFPVVDPVDVLSLVDGDSALTHVAESPDLFDLCRHFFTDLLGGLQGLVHHKLPVFGLLEEKAQNGGPVIRGSLGQDIHKHLLLFGCRQRDVVLDLGTAQTDVLHKTDQYIFRFGPGPDPESHPFHWKSVPPDLPVFYLSRLFHLYSLSRNPRGLNRGIRAQRGKVFIP